MFLVSGKGLFGYTADGIMMGVDMRGRVTWSDRKLESREGLVFLFL